MKKILSALATISLALTVISCHDVIFDTIRDEVKLEDAQVQGIINSIVRFQMDGKEYIFAQNGEIFYKDVDAVAKGSPTEAEPYSGNWKTATKNGLSKVIKLAADSSYLYALSATIEEDKDEGENIETARTVYCSSDGATWNAVTLGSEASTSVHIFCTNAVQNANRHAYANVEGTIYELKGTTASEITTGENDHTTVPTTGAKSAVVLNGSVYFSSGNAMGSNETLTEDATYIYFASGDSVYYSSDGSWSDEIDLNMGTIYAISYTKDYLVLGTNSGYEHAKLNDGIPTTDTSNLPVNVESALSSAYEVRAVLAIDPTKTETAGDLYATATYSGSSSSSTATRSKEGLWAYYPGRSEWNLE